MSSSAPTGNVTCIDEAVQWYTNSVGETPCTTYERLRQLCNPAFVTPNMRPLTPPDSCTDQLSACCCNNIAFDLSMLCMNCQYGRGAGSDIGIDAGIGAYDIYLDGCGPITNGSLQTSVQEGVCKQGIKLPTFLYQLGWFNTGAWFYVYTEQTATLQASNGRNETNLCNTTSTSSTPSSPSGSSATSTTFTSTSSSITGTGKVLTSSHKSSTGAIAGGVVGGIVAVILFAVLFFFLLRRQRRRSGGPSQYKNKRASAPLDIDGNGSEYAVTPFVPPRHIIPPGAGAAMAKSGGGFGANGFVGAGAAAYATSRPSPSPASYPSGSQYHSRPNDLTTHQTSSGSVPRHAPTTSFDFSGSGSGSGATFGVGASMGVAAAAAMATPRRGRDPTDGMSEKQRLEYLNRQRSYAESSRDGSSPSSNASAPRRPGGGRSGSGSAVGEMGERHVDAGISLAGSDLPRPNSGRLPPAYVDTFGVAQDS